VLEFGPPTVRRTSWNKYPEDTATEIKRRRKDGLEGGEGESLEAGAE